MATTLSIVAVFVPVAFMGGIIGRFFYQFGMTVAFAVLVSLFVSFTLTPMLAAWWGVDPHDPSAGGGNPVSRAIAGFNRWFDRGRGPLPRHHRLGAAAPEDAPSAWRRRRSSAPSCSFRSSAAASCPSRTRARST